MSWHNDDDDVDNDSVGWFDPRDYQEPAQPASYPGRESKKARHDRNDPFAYMRRSGYQRWEF
jgi:hypothetical protein